LKGTCVKGYKEPHPGCPVILHGGSRTQVVKLLARKAQIE